MADRLAELVDVRLASAGDRGRQRVPRRCGSVLEVALQWEALAQPVTMATADTHKGIQARREHRPPAFDGN